MVWQGQNLSAICSGRGCRRLSKKWRRENLERHQMPLWVLEEEPIPLYAPDAVCLQFLTGQNLVPVRLCFTVRLIGFVCVIVRVVNVATIIVRRTVGGTA